MVQPNGLVCVSISSSLWWQWNTPSPLLPTPSIACQQTTPASVARMLSIGLFRLARQLGGNCDGTGSGGNRSWFPPSAISSFGTGSLASGLEKGRGSREQAANTRQALAKLIWVKRMQFSFSVFSQRKYGIAELFRVS